MMPDRLYQLSHKSCFAHVSIGHVPDSDTLDDYKPTLTPEACILDKDK